MGNYIVASMLCLFGIVLFSSYVIVRNKVAKNQPTFVVTIKDDIKAEKAKKLIKNYNATKSYYWKYKIQKTYHSNGMRIYTSADTLSREIMLEDK